MFRNSLAAALRHLHRNRLYAAIAVCGLAIGLCAVLLAALYIRSWYSFNHFVVAYRDIYQATMSDTIPGHPTRFSQYTPVRLAPLLQQRFPEVASVSRLKNERVLLRLGDVEHTPSVNSVDPNFFDTFPLRALAGDPSVALSQPNTLVITHGTARQLFGDESPLGRTLQIVLDESAFSAQTFGSKQAVTVGAVIEDIPDGRSQLSGRVYVSGRSAWTQLAYADSEPPRGLEFQNGMSSGFITLVRLHPGRSPQSLRMNLSKLLPQIAGSMPDGERKPALGLVRIDRVNTDPNYYPGFKGRIVMMAVLALVILAIASVNFVNLLTARSGTRAVEVGVRRLAGARRSMLALQFLCEAFSYVIVSVVVAVALTELLLPHFNSFLDANADFEYWKDPALLGWMLLGLIAFGLLAGFWPALVLSSLRPLIALRGSRLTQGRRGDLRQVLVSAQFALLTGLVLAAGLVYMQRQFATEAALRFDTDQLLILEMRCGPARLDRLRSLPGVRDVACSGSTLLGSYNVDAPPAVTADGRHIPMDSFPIDHRMLGLYGVVPLAGRGLEVTDFVPGAVNQHSTRYLINETAMRALGFKSPAAALGPFSLSSDHIGAGRRDLDRLEEIVGVLPDFSMAPVDVHIGPAIFYADPLQFSTISVKLKGDDIPTTLAAIDQIWKDTGGSRGGYSASMNHLTRYFYDEHVQRMYQSMLREFRAFGIASLVAISLALLGLLGLAASTAERRTKEIGIRKALGAATGDVLGLLLWQFSKPLLWANLIAWPVAAWVMQRWLNGFAYHINLPLWLFPATALLTALIALATVSTHALRVARAKPVTALRYE